MQKEDKKTNAEIKKNGEPHVESRLHYYSLNYKLGGGLLPGCCK